MFKSLGERKQQYKGRNKRNGKKSPYHSHKNKCVAHRPIRHYMKSYINGNKFNYTCLEDITFPACYKKTQDWYDVSAPRPSVFKLKNF